MDTGIPDHWCLVRSREHLDLWGLEVDEYHRGVRGGLAGTEVTGSWVVHVLMGIPIYGHLMSFIIKEKNHDQPVDFKGFLWPRETGPEDKRGSSGHPFCSHTHPPKTFLRLSHAMRGGLSTVRYMSCRCLLSPCSQYTMCLRVFCQESTGFRLGSWKV